MTSRPPVALPGVTTPAALPVSLPTTRVPDPFTAPPLRWGILAPGGIARAFADALRSFTQQQIVAVGSRSLERSEAFAGEFGIEVAYGNYQALVEDPDVEAIYVASPHSEHREQALLAIAAGKHVLVEKAFTRNAAEAVEVLDAAKAAGVALMEAMWTRFLPGTDVLRRLLEDDVLGRVTTVFADHGQYFTPDPQHRLFNPDLAGGAILDLGVYPVSFASFVFGRPESITAVGTKAMTGVDGQLSAVLTAGDAQAVVSTTLFAQTPTTAAVTGVNATASLAGPFYAPTTLTVTSRDGATLSHDGGPIRGHQGLAYEAAHFASLVRSGATESPLLPWAETLAIMQTMDEMRRQIDFQLPGE